MILIYVRMLSTVSADQTIKIWSVKDREYNLKSNLEGMHIFTIYCVSLMVMMIMMMVMIMMMMMMMMMM
jgi:hypothetical protein